MIEILVVLSIGVFIIISVFRGDTKHTQEILEDIARALRNKDRRDG